MKKKSSLPILAAAVLAMAALAAWAGAPAKGAPHARRGYGRPHASVPRVPMRTAKPAPAPKPPMFFIWNPGFEWDSEDLIFWDIVDWPGSEGSWFVQWGPFSPDSYWPVAPPPEGFQAAMADQEGPGAHVMGQEIYVPPGHWGLRFMMAFYNRIFDEEPGPMSPSVGPLQPGESGWIIPAPPTLDPWIDAPNQHIRVDIMDPEADPFDVGGGVLRNVFLPGPATPLHSDYHRYVVDMGEFEDQDVVLRFADVDTEFYLQMGVDAVNLFSLDPLSFWDDNDGASMCLDRETGDFVWFIMSGWYEGMDFEGELQVMNGGTQFWSAYGDPYYVYCTYDPINYTAWAYLFDYVTYAYSMIWDSDTTDSPPCFGGDGYPGPGVDQRQP